MKINIPLFVNKEGDIYFGDLLSSQKKEKILVPSNKILKDNLKKIELALIEENNEIRLKKIEQSIKEWLNYEDNQITLNLKIEDGRTFDDEEYKIGKTRYFRKTKIENESDNFFEMFGFEDEVSIKEKEEKQKKESKTQTKKSKESQKIKREPEIIQTELNDNDLKYCDKLKERFIFINYQFERLYHSVYLIANFETKDNNKLVLIKFKNDYLLTNESYLKSYKGENVYENSHGWS